MRSRRWPQLNAVQDLTADISSDEIARASLSLTSVGAWPCHQQKRFGTDRDRVDCSAIPRKAGAPDPVMPR